MTDWLDTQSRVRKALADTNRLRIITLLQGGELCACKLLETVHIGQHTLFHHMKILCDSSLVSARKEGKWVHYSLNKNLFKDTSAMLKLWVRCPLKC